MRTNDNFKRAVLALSAIVAVVLVVPHGASARAPLKYHKEIHAFDSRELVQPTGEEAAPPTYVVEVPGALWLRIHFGDCNLGTKSSVTITSRLDGSTQTHTAQTLSAWSNSTAYFNGDAVEIVLDIAPGETGIFYTIDEVSVGEPQYADESQCGDTDDRVPYDDDRIGRIEPVGCTGWRISSGAYLTAGHCNDYTTDMQLIEFKVPDSTAGGAVVHPAAEHQFPIIASSKVSQNDHSGDDIGNDWAVFRISPNTDGTLPHLKYTDALKFFRVTNEYLPTTVRVTGYGWDSEATRSYTQQTATGAFLGEVYTSASDVYLKHAVDTQGGSSGSPIISQNTGDEILTIGIHTNGGCDDPSYLYNAGTSFENNLLETAIINATPNTVHVDNGHISASVTGTPFHPYPTVGQGVTNVSTGGTVSIVGGTYGRSTAGNLFTAGADGKSMLITAPVGTVYIGN